MMSKNYQLERFNTEVLMKGKENALPCNLSDEWLYVLIDQANALMADQDDENSSCTLLLAALFHILLAKNNSEAVEIEEDEIKSSLALYCKELAIEEVSRKTGIKLAPASIETILTNREVAILSMD